MPFLTNFVNIFHKHNFSHTNCFVSISSLRYIFLHVCTGKNSIYSANIVADLVHNDISLSTRGTLINWWKIRSKLTFYLAKISYRFNFFGAEFGIVCLKDYIYHLKTCWIWYEENVAQKEHKHMVEHFKQAWIWYITYVMLYPFLWLRDRR